MVLVLIIRDIYFEGIVCLLERLFAGVLQAT